MQQYFDGMQRNEDKEEMRKEKYLRKVPERLSLQMNSSMPFLKAAATQMKAMLLSRLVIVRQS